MQQVEFSGKSVRTSLDHSLHALQHAWFTLKLGALVLVVALSPGNYTRRQWHTLAGHIHTSTWQVLGWFTGLAALLSLVLIRIVIVTALSYGLSHYALQMVIRVLVLELIPLCAALFVALRIGLSSDSHAHAHRTALRHTHDIDLTFLTTQLTPRALADAFAVLTLAVLSSALVLVLSYINLYGLSPWGLPGFTRTVGLVFDASISLGFILKVLLFSWAVAIVPMAAALRKPQSTGRMQPGSSLLFFSLFALEAGALTIQYI